MYSQTEGATTKLLHVKRQCHQKDDSKCRAHSCAARSCDPSVQPRLSRRVEKDTQEARETLYSQTEVATTKLLHAKSNATTKRTSSLRLTAALRAAATPRFNQDFQAELRKPRERHKRACLIALGFENQVKERCI